MASIESRATISAPLDLVVRTSQDYSVRTDWDSFPEQVAVVPAPVKIVPGALPPRGKERTPPRETQGSPTGSIHETAGRRDEVSVGTRVHIKSKLGMEMLVEFVQVMPPGRSAVKMLCGPWFLAKFAGSWNFEEVSPGVTAARFRYSLTARPALLRFLIEPVATLYFSRVLKQRLAGLKAYCEGQVRRPEETGGASTAT